MSLGSQYRKHLIDSLLQLKPMDTLFKTDPSRPRLGEDHRSCGLMCPFG